MKKQFHEIITIWVTDIFCRLYNRKLTRVLYNQLILAGKKFRFIRNLSFRYKSFGYELKPWHYTTISITSNIVYPGNYYSLFKSHLVWIILHRKDFVSKRPKTEQAFKIWLFFYLNILLEIDVFIFANKENGWFWSLFAYQYWKELFVFKIYSN